MIKKGKLRKWASAIEEMQKDLHTGAGALISSTYSKENNELYNAAESLKNLLTIYYNYETLSKEQLFRLNKLTEYVGVKAKAYITAKAGQNAIIAKGDKELRLNAAKKLQKLTVGTKDDKQSINSIFKAEKNTAPDTLENLPEEYKKIETALGDVKEIDTAQGIITNLNKYLKDSKANKAKYDLFALRLKATTIRKAYEKAHNESLPNNKNTTYGDLTKKFKELYNLHRIALTTYNTPDEFLKIYEANRHKIAEVIDIYKWALKNKDSDKYDDNQVYKNFVLALSMTKKDFQALSEKITALDLIAQHMDTQMMIFTNPATTRLSANEMKEIQEKASKSGQEYKDYLNSQQPDNEDNDNNVNLEEENKINLIKSYHKLATLKKAGIEQFYEPTLRKEAAVINNTVTRHGITRTFKFLDAQARVGRKAAGATLITGDIDVPAFTKAKLGKLSLKYNSKGGHVMIGGHAGLGGTLVGGTAAAEFSLKNPLDARAFVTGTAEAYAARGVAKMFIGDGNMNIISKTTANIAHAQANATFGVGHVTKTDANGKVELDGYGFTAKAGATASLVNVSSWNAFTLFGVRIAATYSFKAGGVGAEGEATFILQQGAKLGLGGALGIGGSVYLSVDWRYAVAKVKRWKKRRAISKKILEAKKKQLENKKANAELNNDNNAENLLIEGNNQAHLRNESTDSLFNNSLNEAIDKMPKRQGPKPQL